MGFLHPPAPSVPGVETLSLGRDPLWAAVPSEHRFAGRAALRFHDLAQEDLVLFPRSVGPMLHDAIARRVTAAAGRMRVAAEARRLHAQLAIVSGGIGIGLIARSAARTLSFVGVSVVPIEDSSDWLFTELEVWADERIFGDVARRLNRPP